MLGLKWNAVYHMLLDQCRGDLLGSLALNACNFRFYLFCMKILRFARECT